MLLRALSTLALVRVTVGYSVALVVVGMALGMAGPRVADDVASNMSTNLYNLAHGHVGTLVGSAFIDPDGPIHVWLPGLLCLLGLTELLWGSGSLILSFGLGHVGATLVVAAGLAAAVGLGWLPTSIARASDVGTSYGVAAVLGVLTVAIPRRWRAAWVGCWIMVAGRAVYLGGDFTSVGHLIALVLGMLLSARFHLVARMTLARWAMLAIGAAYGYLVLANFELIPLPAGLLGTLTCYSTARLWRTRLVRPWQAVTWRVTAPTATHGQRSSAADVPL
jgi:hypothetical protein